MWPGAHAATTPDKPAVVMAATGETITYRELNDRSNQLAQLFWSTGLRFGDHIAVLMDNNARYLEVCWAAQRSGLVYTTLNWHFTAEEAAYIVDDCDAQAIVVCDATRALAEALVDRMPRVTTRLAIHTSNAAPIEGYVDYDDAIAAFPAAPLAEELEGTPMLYSSGTTGQPKGVSYHIAREPIGTAPARLASMTNVFHFSESSVYLSPAPLYHSAPLFYCMSTLRLGATAVIMEQFDPLLALAYIERYRVTHSQWVPTMFVRMWKLTDEERHRYDLSSHEVAVHAAAPCPVDVKRRMIEWWGPIIMEYYSATEGAGATIIMSDEWLAHPGSVGRTMLGPIHIVDDASNEVLPPGEIGVVWFEPLDGRTGFEYHKDSAKTRDSMNSQGWSTVGDMGYLDAEGYLFLTDRKTFMIVSGGVNIYPQEAENLLVDHPKVFDVAVFGVPNEEMGEEVKAVVQPIDWDLVGPDLERELLEYCRTHLAHYKCPRTVDFERELPRQPTGKLYKRLLRDRYWGAGSSRIVEAPMVLSVGPFTPDDFSELSDLAVAAWSGALDRDWSAPAGTLEWSCFATADHTVDCVFSYAFFFASRRLDAYPPFSELHALPGAVPTDLVNGLAAACEMLSAVISVAPPNARAVIFGRARATGNANDFAARGAHELILHAHDVCAGLGVPFDPPRVLCERLRDHTSGWPIGPPFAPTNDPWGDLLARSGRARPT